MRYSIEVLRTVNKTTGKKRYFKKVCGHMMRISLYDYDDLYNTAYGFNNVFTTSNKNVVQHFIGLTFYNL